MWVLLITSITNRFVKMIILMTTPQINLKKIILKLTLLFSPFDCATHYKVLRQEFDLEVAYL